MLLVLSIQYFTRSRSHIAELAIQQRLPTMFIFKVYVQAGGLISYGVALLWQIYSRCGLLQIHFRQCGHRRSGGD